MAATLLALALATACGGVRMQAAAPIEWSGATASSSGVVTASNSDRWKAVAGLGAAAALLIAWDVYLYKTAPVGGSVSGSLQGLGRDHLIIPFGFGVLMGHVFWAQKIK